MILVVVILLLLSAAPAAGSLLPRVARPPVGLMNLAAAAQLALLGAAALCALQVSDLGDPWWRAGLVIAAATAACLGGSGISTAVLDTATRHDARRRPDVGAESSGDASWGAVAPRSRPLQDLAEDDRPVLRGGAWIGLLERLAVVSTLLASWPEGLAVVLAVKGLARYSELKRPNGAAERFIIGTFCSVLWAAACAGVAALGLTG
ncbi:hypothetical protein [Nesterenkonia sp. PF2B19]|uniref:hypothetical protein n=1 Tax=Nesterenkonia sp. PF2B19 TaxID=1881858 RepID=UPI0008728C0F|nr:hypothetical protein [Nesterenkonia sp. PF2B19]